MRLNNSILEILLSVYVVLGALAETDPITYVFYLLGIFIIFLSYMYLLNRRYCLKRSCLIHIEILTVIFGIFTFFLFKNVPIKLLFIRIATLSCIFGITICFAPEIKINAEHVLKLIKKLLLLVAAIMFLDIMIQKIVGFGIWRPVIYLGYRYSGPFYDSNYAAVYLGSIIPLVCLDGEYRMIKKTFFIILLTVDIFFCGSLAVFIGLSVTMLYLAIFKNLPFDKVMFLHIFLLMFYILILYIWKNNQVLFHDIGVELLKSIYAIGAEVKYKSLEFRFSTQYKALEIGIKHFGGQGPYQLIPQLGLDTHNSFFSFLFEEGYLGILLLMLSLRYQAGKINRMAKFVVLFITINIFVLNIHYTTVYMILLLAIQLDDKADGRNSRLLE